MPTTLGAVKVLQDAGVLYSPGKASNAGGVATSGLEMSQNSMRLPWPKEEVDQRLHQIMKNIHQTCVETLLQDTRGAYDDILIPGGFLGLTNGALNPINDKGEWRSFLDPFLRHAVGEHDDGHVHGMPASPGTGDIERPPGCHQDSR